MIDYLEPTRCMSVYVLLRESKMLTGLSLNLNGNQISDAGATSISPELWYVQLGDPIRIELFLLSCSQIGEICDGSSGAVLLSHLGLVGNPIGAAGATAIGIALWYKQPKTIFATLYFLLGCCIFVVEHVHMIFGDVCGHTATTRHM